jgi:hypothetical protein
MKDNFGGQFPGVLFNVILLSLLTSSSRQNTGNYSNKKVEEEKKPFKTNQNLNVNKGYNDYFGYDPSEVGNIFDMNFGDYYNQGYSSKTKKDNIAGEGINLEDLKMPFPEYYQEVRNEDKTIESKYSLDVLGSIPNTSHFNIYSESLKEEELTKLDNTNIIEKSSIKEDLIETTIQEEFSESTMEVDLPKEEPVKIVWKNFPKPIK